MAIITVLLCFPTVLGIAPGPGGIVMIITLLHLLTLYYKADTPFLEVCSYFSTYVMNHEQISKTSNRWYKIPIDAVS